jgi:Uncharacterised nucleotidyltransferase
MDRDPASDAHLVGAALSLRADVLTREVVHALSAVGIEPILLRGPAIARLLYPEGAARTYGDVDLLIRTGDISSAEGVVSALGFEDRTVSGVIEGDRPTYAHTWIRPGDAAVVDLHFTLSGAHAPPAEVWEICASEVERTSVGSIEVRVLRPPGQAVVVADHAAAHGVGVKKPLEDLTRALEQLPEETWREAAALAERLQATEAFAAGLRLLPTGEDLADRLALPRDVSVETALRASTAPPTALGFEWLSRTPGARPKIRFLARKLFPNADFMRAWSPLARRGRAGLVAAYAMRVFWLLRHALPGLIAWRRARTKRPPT